MATSNLTMTEDDEASPAILEAERRDRHHDIVCIVLKECMRMHVARSGYAAKLDLDDVQRLAFKTADDFYPPPKPFDHALVSELLKDQEK